MSNLELEKKIYNLAYRRGVCLSILKSIKMRLDDESLTSELDDVISELDKPVEESKYKLPV
jgi:hypothetical protein